MIATENARRDAASGDDDQRVDDLLDDLLTRFPPATTPQFQDLTTNPRPPLVGPSTACQELHPNWSWDQQRIFLASSPTMPLNPTPTLFT